MIKRRLSRLVLTTWLTLLCLIAQAAGAVGIEAIIRTSTEVRGDITSGDIQLFLNGTPLPVVPEQTVTLQQFDVLRAETSASATHESGVSVLSDRRVTVDLNLEPNVLGASVVTTLDGRVETTPRSEGGDETARADNGGVINCDAFISQACSAPGLPGSLAFSSGATSITIGEIGNSILVNNVSTDTGRIGGPEIFDPLSTTLNLQPPQADGQQTSVSVGAVGLAIFLSTASASGNLEIFVSELDVIPVPAAAWLFASALFALGYPAARRR